MVVEPRATGQKLDVPHDTTSVPEFPEITEVVDDPSRDIECRRPEFGSLAIGAGPAIMFSVPGR